MSALNPTAAAPTAGAAEPRAPHVTRGAGSAPRRPDGRSPAGGQARPGAGPVRHRAPAEGARVASTICAARYVRSPMGKAAREGWRELSFPGGICRAAPKGKGRVLEEWSPRINIANFSIAFYSSQRDLSFVPQSRRGAGDVWPPFHRR